MTADVELLPCPCGAPAKIYPTGTEVGPRERLVASCDDPECQWSMVGFGPEQVAERWNRRAAAAQAAEIEALRAELDRNEASLVLQSRNAEKNGLAMLRAEARAERLAEAGRRVTAAFRSHGNAHWSDEKTTRAECEASMLAFDALLRDQEEGK